MTQFLPCLSHMHRDSRRRYLADSCKRGRTDRFGACGPSASLTPGSPCGRPPPPLRGAVVEPGLLSVGGSILCDRLGARSGPSKYLARNARPDGLLGAARLVLRFAPDRRRWCDGVQLGRLRRPSCRTRLVFCREFELKRRMSGSQVYSQTMLKTRARRDSNSRPPGSKGKLAIFSCFEINHLRRLPASNPVSPWHSYGTPSLGLARF